MARVSEIRHVGYAVTDLATEAAFYRDTWGLKGRRRKGRDVAFRRAGA